MKQVADLSILISVICIIVAILSRVLMKPVAGVFASSILEFAAVCLLLAIALLLREK